MKKFLPILSLLAFCLLCTPLLPRAAGKDDSPLVRVAYLGAGANLEKLAHLSLKGDIQEVLCATAPLDTLGDLHAFALLPLRPLTLTMYAVDGVDQQGELVLGKALHSERVSKEDVYILQCPLSEGIPGLMVCAQPEGSGGRRCWPPSLSGVDGSPVFAPGFAPGQLPR